MKLSVFRYYLYVLYVHEGSEFFQLQYLNNLPVFNQNAATMEVIL